jgi:hypothetical protein
MKRRRFYEKPSEKAAREKAEGIRRARKAARKKAQWEGVVAAPKKKKVLPGKTARPRFASESGLVRPSWPGHADGHWGAGRQKSSGLSS